MFGWLKKKQKNPENIKNQINVKYRRILVIVLFTLLSVLVYNIYLKTFTQKGIILKESPQFFLLKQFSIVLISLLTAILIRYLIKLIFERRNKTLGFRLKTKLILVFLLIGALPILFFLYLTNDYLNTKIQNWFHPQTTTTIDKSIKILQEIQKKQDTNLQQLPEKLIPYFVNGKFDSLELLTLSWNIEESYISGLVIYDAKGLVLNHIRNPSRESQAWEKIPLSTLRKLKNNQPRMVKDNGIIHHVTAFQNKKKQGYFLEIYVDDQVLPNNNASLLLKDLGSLQQSLGLEKTLDTSYQVNLVLFSTLLILAFFWAALYISKNLLDPIEKLLLGVNRLRQGRFDALVEISNNDEMRLLAENFNTMVREMEANTALLKEKENLLQSANVDLEKQNLTLQSIFKNIRTGALLLRADGKVEEANQAFLELIGKTQVSIGEQYETWIPKNLTEVIQSLKTELDKKNTPYTSRDFNLSLLQQEQHLKIDGYRLLNPNQKEVGFLLMVDSLNELDKLLRAKAWQEVAKRMAHEIKNPLTPIRISAERLKKLLMESNFSESKKSTPMLETILSEVQTLKTMIDQFSNFARVPEIKMELQNLNSFLEQIFQNTQSHIPENIDFSLLLDPKIPKVLFDAELLKRALYNLLDNAISALSEKTDSKRIGIESVFDVQKNEVRIHIRDNGPGIPSDLLFRIFEPYVTTKKNGMGLGLAIVNRIVQDHFGTITLQSNPQGTVFSITLPLKPTKMNG